MVDKQAGGDSGISFGALRVAASALLSRLGLGALTGDRFDGKRKYYDVFGYKQKLTFEDFRLKYERQDIVTRIIDAPPQGTWSNPPTFVNAGMQAEWETLRQTHNLWSIIERADRLARLGEFSLLLVGSDKGLPNTALPAGNQELLYLRPISVKHVKAIKFEQDASSPRFGKPAMYTIGYSTAASTSMDSLANASVTVVEGTLEVHHSRIIHIVENSLEDEVFGIPIISKIFNLLDDLLKITGGTAEMFWSSANRGMQIDVDKEMDMQPADAAALTDEIDEYIHGLRRFIRTRGVKIENLGSDVASPQGVFEMIMSLLAGTTGIPKRILMGSEAGQLASEQDRANWAERIEERRLLFAEPVILRPLAMKLQEMGLLGKGEIKFEWPSAFIMSPLEEAQVMAQKARAIGNISRQTGGATPMQLTSRVEARGILGLVGDLQESDLMTPKLDDNNNPIPVEDPADSDPNVDNIDELPRAKKDVQE